MTEQCTFEEYWAKAGLSEDHKHACRETWDALSPSADCALCGGYHRWRPCRFGCTSHPYAGLGRQCVCPELEKIRQRIVDHQEALRQCHCRLHPKP